jgi:hypothetical protein
MKLSELDASNIDKKWLFDFISAEFKKPDENITALRILTKLGVGIHDQVGQLHNKVFINKFNLLLNILKEECFLVLKDNRHDSLGIKELAYKLAPSHR